MKKRKLYVLAMLLFIVYVGNILFGKLSIMLRDSFIPIALPDQVAAIILFLSVCFFTAGIYLYEEVDESI